MFLTSKQIPIDFNNTATTKFKKYHKVKYKNSMTSVLVQKSASTFVAQDLYYMPVKQLICILKILKPALKKTRRYCTAAIHNYPNTILTKKPKDIRMGRGKGAPTERVSLTGKTPLITIEDMPNKDNKKLFLNCAPKIKNSKYIEYSKW